MPNYYRLNLSNGKWQQNDAQHMPYTFKDRQGNAFNSEVRVYKLALIGVGSSIAYYLNALGAPYVQPAKGSIRQRAIVPLRPMDRHAIVFGSQDAWDASVRGDGFINHESHLISQWGNRVTELSPDYMERAELAKQNGDVFQRAIGVERVIAEVTAVRRFGHVFKVDVGGRYYLAQKVVVGMGAGPHQRPRTMRVYGDAHQRVVDLDEFMRTNPRDGAALPKGSHVVVNGANAGIDAVERAASLEYKVTWFIGSRPPQLLSGNRLDYAPELAKKAISVDYDISIVPEDNDQIKILYKRTKGGRETMLADLYVYALGQDPMASGAVGDVLITRGGLSWDELQPIYDINQVYGDPFQTVLGLQSRDSEQLSEQLQDLGLPASTSERGIQIIGAAATSLAAVTEGRTPRIRHNFRIQFSDSSPLSRQRRELIERAESYLKDKSVLDSMNGSVRCDVGSVIQHAQLVGVRGAVAAMTGFVPEYLGKDVNLSTDDRTMLRIYLARAFPALDERSAQEFIYKVMAQRKKQALGYTEKAKQALLRDLVRVWLLQKGMELQRVIGGEITHIRTSGKRRQVTISLTPMRYKL